MMRMSNDIKNGDIRFCETTNEEYLVLGRTPMQKGAYRCIWQSGLRTHDMVEDIKRDKIVYRTNENKFNTNKAIQNFMMRCKSR